MKHENKGPKGPVLPPVSFASLMQLYNNYSFIIVSNCFTWQWKRQKARQWQGINPDDCRWGKQQDIKQGDESWLLSRSAVKLYAEIRDNRKTLQHSKMISVYANVHGARAVRFSVMWCRYSVFRKHSPLLKHDTELFDIFFWYFNSSKTMIYFLLYSCCIIVYLSG